MKKYLSIFSVILVAMLCGAAANVAVADSDYGWDGRGPGMMGGYGPGYGMGPGMMGGGYGMGHGMMGYRDYRELSLSSEQRTKITQIRKATRAKQWALMDDMMDAQDALQDLYDADKQDSAAINKQYKVIEDLRRQMVDNSVDANNRVNAILTKEQREKLRERGRWHGPMMRGY